MARYFQHINSEDDLFQNVTELEMIDNSDPNFIMFYFKDGSKCTKQFIGEVNSDATIYGKKVFVELTSPGNKWSFKKTKIEETTQYNYHEGVKYESADPYMIGHENEIGKQSFIVAKLPNNIPNYQTEPDERYYIMDMGGDMTAPDIITDPSIEEHKPSYSSDTNVIDEAVSTDITEDVIKEETSKKAKIYNIDANQLISAKQQISFSYNGKAYVMDAEEFFKNAIVKPEEKIVEKEVIKEVIVNKEEHLDIVIDETQKSLIDNMIDMSQKDKCDIDMAITLSLPPVSVYKIIKQVYPEGMSKAFVNIIADRMQMLELKSAVAAGLLEYYDENETIEVKNDDK